MATTQPGGIYQVGDKLVDANGKETKRVRAEKAAVEPKSPAPKSGDEFDAEKATKEQLAAEAERRGITVTRADGKEGEPLVDDYRAALK